MRVLLFLLVSGVLSFSAAQFEDVPAGHWAESAVLRMTELGVIMGFPDGKFHGAEYLTRYQTSVLLSRMWDSWSTEQLSDIWREFLGVSSRVDQLELTLGRMKLALDDIEQQLQGGGDLEGFEQRLGDLETLLAQARGGFVDGVTFSDFERIYGAMVQKLEQDVVALELQIKASEPTPVEGLTELELELERLSVMVENLSMVPNDFAKASQVSLLDTRIQHLEAQTKDLEKALMNLPTLETPADTSAFSVTVSSGLLGPSWQGGFGVQAAGEKGNLAASVSDSGVQARAAAFITPSLSLQARLDTQAEVGMVGLGVNLGGLELGVLAGVDDGLAGTLYLDHDPQDMIPGLSVKAAASLAEDNFALQLRASYLFQGPGFGIGPSMAYRSIKEHVYLAPGLEAFVEIGTATLLVSGEYVFVSDKQGATNYPQADLHLTLDSGAFVNIMLDSGGPDFRSLPDFSHAPRHDVFLGVKVGYTFKVWP